MCLFNAVRHCYQFANLNYDSTLNTNLKTLNVQQLAFIYSHTFVYFLYRKQKSYIRTVRRYGIYRCI